MKIALLNLPFDNNYGGNLQRYALVRVVEGMGHQVIHINLRRKHKLPLYKMPYSYTKRLVRILCGDRTIHLNEEKHQDRLAEVDNVMAELFYAKYIPHTPVVYDVRDIMKVCCGNFDTYLVGSDQVWRRDMTSSSIGLENFLLRFTGSEARHVKRVAYAVSLGNDAPIPAKMAAELGKDYARFDAVSVRERSALAQISRCGWTAPSPVWTLDPTLLLTPDDYDSLIAENDVADSTSGKIYCYVLDKNSMIMETIRRKEKELGLDSVIIGLKDTPKVSIPQWLSNIRNCEYVVTDSYHGVVFSVLFNKPFMFLGNSKRGNVRIESLFTMLNTDKDSIAQNWTGVNDLIALNRKKSMDFLNDSLR